MFGESLVKVLLHGSAVGVVLNSIVESRNRTGSVVWNVWDSNSRRYEHGYVKMHNISKNPAILFSHGHQIAMK